VKSLILFGLGSHLKPINMFTRTEEKEANVIISSEKLLKS